MISFFLILIASFFAFLFYQEKKKSQLQRFSLFSNKNEELSSDVILDRLLFNSIPQSFLLIDFKNKILFANESAKKFFNHRQILSRPLEEIFLHQELMEIISSCQQKNQGVIYRNSFLFPFNSSQIHCKIDIAPIGTQGHFRLIIEDITSRIQTEQMRKDFVINSSHEFKTPLAIIDGYLNTLLDEEMKIKKEKQKSFLNIMKKHTSRLIHMVEQMLTDATLENEQTLLKKENFSLRECIKSVLELLSKLIEEKQAKIQIQIPEKTFLFGDFIYWQQIFLNLIENSLHSNPQGIEIEIQYSQEKQKQIIKISDNGIGIPRKDIPFIFDRFYRVSKDRNQEIHKGNGLGLSIVKRAILAHQAKIQVYSEPTQKTIFAIEISK